MPLHSSLEHFADRPRPSAVFASPLIVMGLVSISGIVPLSPDRSYFAGHKWLLALLGFGHAFRVLRDHRPEIAPGRRPAIVPLLCFTFADRETPQ